MCCIRRKLSLYFKSIRETFQHLVIRDTKLVQFLYSVFPDSRIRQILSLYFLDFLRKFMNGSERMTTDKISRHTAKKRQYGRKDQTVFFVVCFIVVHLNREILCKLIPIILRNADIYLIRIICVAIPDTLSDIISPGIHSLLQRIDIINPVFIDKQRQTTTDQRNIQGNDTGKSPLQ